MYIIFFFHFPIEAFKIVHASLGNIHDDRKSEQSHIPHSQTKLDNATQNEYSNEYAIYTWCIK